MVGDAGIIALWQGALLQALADAGCARDTSPSRSAGAVAAARLWLGGDSGTLRLALDAAGFDRDWWMTRALPVLRQQWAAVDAGRATRCRAIRAPPRLPRPDSAAGRYLWQPPRAERPSWGAEGGRGRKG